MLKISLIIFSLFIFDDVVYAAPEVAIYQRESYQTSSSVNIIGSPNIDFTVTSPKKLKTGYNPKLKKKYSENPKAGYVREAPDMPETPEMDVEYPRYSEETTYGKYMFEVCGRVEGDFLLTFMFIDDGATLDQKLKGYIKKGEIKNYVANYSKGKFDISEVGITSKSTTLKEKKSSLEPKKSK